MGLLTLEATDSLGEQLAEQAAGKVGVAVGFDPEFNCANFDSEEHSDEELEAAIAGALNGIDPEWRSHLQRVD